jgi:hypothetical protein
VFESAEVVGFDEEASVPELVEDKTDDPITPDRLDLCDPAIPLAEEAESVVTEVVILLETVRPDVEVELGVGLVDDEEFWR